jgi:hypothetical protein
MADVPGICELPLTRAVIQYRDRHELEGGGRIQDIGLGLVLEGRYASAARVVDLGCGEEKHLDLGSELVILDWVYEPTLDHVRGLLSESGSRGSAGHISQEEESQRYCFDIALRVLARIGYGPLTRPTILRIGFRDICKDLDLHDGTAVRVQAAGTGVLRIHLDYDGAALVVRTGLPRPNLGLEGVLEGAFPNHRLRRILPVGPAASLGYQIRFPLPLTFGEARALLRDVRLGVGHMLARYEPGRFHAVQSLLDTFGTRETLARLAVRDSTERTAPVEPHREETAWRVH